MITYFQLSVWIGVGVFLIHRGVWTFPKNYVPHSSDKINNKIHVVDNSSVTVTNNMTICCDSTVTDPSYNKNISMNEDPSSNDTITSINSTVITHTTTDSTFHPGPPKSRNLQQISSSLAMIVTGVAMVTVGPAILICKKIDRRRQHQRLLKVSFNLPILFLNDIYHLVANMK